MKNSKIRLKTIFLIVSIVAFLVVLVGASFAYYATTTASTSSGSSIANANVTVPVGCTFTAMPVSNCSIIGQTGTTLNSTDNIITTAEMTESYKNTQVAQASCSLNVVVNGNKGCTCNYVVKLEKSASSNTFVPTSALLSEFTATIKRGTTVVAGEANINTIAGSGIEHTLTVSTTKSAASQVWNMIIKFYNIDSNQGTNNAGKSYSYQLKAYASVCNGFEYSTYTMTPFQVSVAKGAYGTFSSNADLNKLTSVKVDGEEISSNNYTATSGSTIITLKPSYTSTLSIGTHRLDIVSNDGFAKTTFNVDNGITFTINGTTYKASTNMTWLDWIKSYGQESTSNGIVQIIDGNVLNMLGQNLIIDNLNVQSTDLILSGGAYAFPVNLSTLSSKCSGSGTSVGSKYSCSFDDGISRYYYVIGTNLDDSNRIDLLAEQNFSNSSVPKTMPWCNKNGSNPNNSKCNHDGLDPYIDYIQSLYGLDVLVSIPTYAHLTSIGCTTAFKSCPTWAYDYNRVYISSGIYGYWLSNSKSTSNAWCIDYYGDTYDLGVNNGTLMGLRPVITLAKT